MRHSSFRQNLRSVLLCVAIVLSWCGLVRAEDKPSILFAVPGENRYAYVGFDYMRAVANAGFAVDYIEGAQGFTWDRIKKYNVVVILDFPAANADSAIYSQFSPSEAGRLNDYFAVLDKFRAAGGGILLHYSPSTGGGAPNQLLNQWGIQFPLQSIHDTRTGVLTNLNDGNECAVTDQVAASPVSDGVKQIWYPNNGPHYAGWHTMPIIVDSSWQPVVRASKTAWTEVATYSREAVQPSPQALIPKEPIKDPVIFAIRDGGGAGRLAAIQTWHQFSIGSGMKFLYNNEILEKGLNGQSSQYGRLLLNTYHWLAGPSLKSGAVGGYVQEPNRLLEPSARPETFAQFAELSFKDIQASAARSKGKIYRGLIGAQTSLSGGEGTVDDYAKAAAEAGLDYLVILEDFAGLTPEKLQQLKDAVKKASTPTLRIYAGYRMKNNIGNDMFIYGINPTWPPDKLLVGPHHEIFNLQYQDAQGKYGQSGEPLDFLLRMFTDANLCTVGYFNFTRSGPSAMQMHDLRAYSAAAVRSYEAGKLVEDVTPDYLTTWGATIGPVPISMNLVRSPQELRQAMASHESLTYAQARSLDLLWQDALRWNDSYDGPNVFVSNGPMVQAWPNILRATTFGAEPFAPGRSLQDAPLRVTSEVGLKEIRIYDGQELFRRFICGGAKEFKQELFLSGVVNQNLTLVAEDTAGNSAVTYPLRHYKEGVIGPIFCGDHVNDCGYILLAHGPIWPRFSFTPPISDAGQTWDGGPLALRQLLTFSQESWPQFDTEAKRPEWNAGAMPYQTPMLEFADEGATRCRMTCDRKLAAEPEAVASNPWVGYGPLEPTKLIDAWASLTVFNPYVTGVDPMSWGGNGDSRGPVASLFTQKITFKSDDTINRCILMNGGWRPPKMPASVQFVVGRGGQILDQMDVSVGPETEHSFRVETGDWFAFYSALPSNTCFVVNRGPVVQVHFYPTGDLWVRLIADLDKKKVKAGDTYDSELFAITWPMDQKFITTGSLVQVANYLAHPTGLQIIRGKQASGTGGLLELTPENYGAELSIPRSSMPVVVPVRVSGLNKRWSAGLYQLDGFRTHYYSKGNSGYRALGLDSDGRAYVPMHVSVAPLTHDLIGHPVVADSAGKDLFIQVTCLGDDGTKLPTWHISVNNPTDSPVETTLHKAMDLPGLTLSDVSVTLKPGEYRVLDNR
jgi:hypothetical protein